MALYISIRVNDRLIASAAVQNVSPHGLDICDYRGNANTEAFGGRPLLKHDDLEVRGHDRRVSVWRLVAKIADRLASSEEGRAG